MITIELTTNGHRLECTAVQAVDGSLTLRLDDKYTKNTIRTVSMEPATARNFLRELSQSPDAETSDSLIWARLGYARKGPMKALASAMCHPGGSGAFHGHIPAARMSRSRRQHV